MRTKPAGSGRKAGTRNKATKTLEARIKGSGFEPIEAMCRIGKQAEQDGDLGLAVQCAKELAGYIHSKKRSVEIKQGREEPVIFNLTLSESLKLIDNAQKDAGIVPEPPKEEVKRAEPPEVLITRDATTGEHFPAAKVEAAPVATWAPLDYGDTAVV